jgi:enhancing lycopene biosynthesis protein 2
MSTKKFAVVLSGCGVFDGAEIHEATLSLYALAKMTPCMTSLLRIYLNIMLLIM